MILKFKWTILWSIFVLLLCGIPGDKLPHESWMDDWMIDKIVHAGLYSILLVLFLVESKGKKVVLGVLYGIFLGVSVEFLQQFVFYKRSFDTMDMIANSVGCGLGVLLFFQFLFKKM